MNEPTNKKVLVLRLNPEQKKLFRDDVHECETSYQQILFDGWQLWRTAHGRPGALPGNVLPAAVNILRRLQVAAMRPDRRMVLARLLDVQESDIELLCRTEIHPE